jgi:hypothetical protein
MSPSDFLPSSIPDLTSENVPPESEPRVEVSLRSPQDRLSLPTPFRILLVTFLNASFAFTTGFTDGSRRAGLQFLAENSHRMPKSEKAWFIYHRYKSNYQIANGLQAGLTRMGRWSLWPAVFLGTESMLDDFRGGDSLDLGSTVVAGVMTGGIYSIFSKSSRT